MSEEAKALEKTVKKAFDDIAQPMAERLEQLRLKIEEFELPDTEAAIKNSFLKFNSCAMFRPPPPFSGGFGESLSDWAGRLGHYMTLQGISDADEKYKIASLESNLIGAALASFHEIKQDGGTVQTFQNMITALKQIYPDGRDSDIHQQLIFDRKQKHSESVVEYVDKLRKMARSAYPTLNEAAREMIIKPIFIRGVHPTVYEGIKYRDFANLSEAVKTAQYAESQLFRDGMFRAMPVISSISETKMSHSYNKIMEKIIELEEIIKMSDLTAEKAEGTSSVLAMSHEYANLRTPHMVVSLNKTVNVSALIDTGAVYSLLDAEVAKKLKNLNIASTRAKPLAANGGIIPVLGSTLITVECEDVQETIMVYIQENCSAEMILGTNFLCRFKNVHFNWAKSCIKFKEANIQCEGMIYSSPENRSCVILNDTFHLLPRTIATVQGQVLQNKRAQERYKQQYDKKARNFAYKIGDLVLKESQVAKKGLARKLMPLYLGPYKILKINYPNLEISSVKDGNITEVIHVNRTKPYVDGNPNDNRPITKTNKPSQIDFNLDESDNSPSSNEDV